MAIYDNEYIETTKDGQEKLRVVATDSYITKNNNGELVIDDSTFTYNDIGTLVLKSSKKSITTGINTTNGWQKPNMTIHFIYQV